MFLIVPRELTLLDYVFEFGLVPKEECQVSSKNTLLHVTQHCFVLCRAQMGENIMAFVLLKTDQNKLRNCTYRGRVISVSRALVCWRKRRRFEPQDTAFAHGLEITREKWYLVVFI